MILSRQQSAGFLLAAGQHAASDSNVLRIDLTLSREGKQQGFVARQMIEHAERKPGSRAAARIACGSIPVNDRNTPSRSGSSAMKRSAATARALAASAWAFTAMAFVGFFRRPDNGSISRPFV